MMSKHQLVSLLTGLAYLALLVLVFLLKALNLLYVLTLIFAKLTFMIGLSV